MAIIYATILVGADRRSFEYADLVLLFRILKQNKGTPKTFKKHLMFFYLFI
ncbi:MAG: hypothetical protein P1P64_03925 [Treponemataceae bacterium]